MDRYRLHTNLLGFTYLDRRIMETYFIYGLCSTEDSIIRYIGISKDVPKRILEHHKDLNRAKVNTHKKNWIKSVLNGGYAIEYQLIDKCESQVEAFQKEINYIRVFKSFGCKLVNGTLGGDGVICTEETRLKMSKSNKGRIHSKSSKELMSKSRKGKKLSLEHAKNISIALKAKGRKPNMTKEICEKISMKLLGRVSPRKGITLSQETKDKISLGKTGLKYPSMYIKVHQLDINGVFLKTFDSITEAKKETGAINIHRCAYGLRKTCGGYIWKFNL